MLGKYIPVKRRNRDEGEKPFWISFADLMSALMVMFLLVMSVALLAITKNVSEAEKKQADRVHEIDTLWERIEQTAQGHPGITVDRNRNVIDFGDRARFDTGSSSLTTEQVEYLTAFVSDMLGLARDELAQKWLKRVVVEGFADQRGDYLLNLNLSLQRSERVLCTLLSPARNQQKTLSADEKEQVRDLFLVGGYSFNSAKKSLEESRRIELRLEFYGIDEAHAKIDDIPRNDFGQCRIR
jgi:outer membrane protein OmpA-like peptidoglycan-associated protein